MKNVITIGVAAAVVTFTAAFRAAETPTAPAQVLAASSVTKATEKPVNLSQSTLKWKGKKVTGEHTGTLVFSKGTLLFDKKVLTGGDFTVDMTSLTVTDL